MTKRILYIIIFILFTVQGHSQAWSRYKYEFYYGAGLTNFMGDVCAPTNSDKLIWINFFNTIGITGNAGLRYKFADRQYVRGSLFLGQLYGEDPANDPKYWYRGISFNSFFTEISVKYEFMIWKEKKRVTVYRKLGESAFKNFSMPTYLFIGAGGIFNVGKFSNKRGLNLSEVSYTNFAPVIPFGIGFKYKINKLTYINLEAEWHFTITDGIDNAIGTPENSYGEWYDQYQSITFNIVHKLRQNQNGTPKFRRR